jgi:hypothetical protein
MCCLGRDLGVEAMALYRYVSGREDVLEAVVAMLFGASHTALATSRPAAGGITCDPLPEHAGNSLDHPSAFTLVPIPRPATLAVATVAECGPGRGLPDHPVRPRLHPPATGRLPVVQSIPVGLATAGIRACSRCLAFDVLMRGSRRDVQSEPHLRLHEPVIHSTRVAARRLRSTLRTLQATVNPDRAEAVFIELSC